MQYTGEIAALLTAISFSFTSVLFTLAGRKVGADVVNRTRLLFALAVLSTIHFFLTGSAWPAFTETERWFWMGTSGIIGLALGDAFLFQAFIWIGPRLTMLMMSLTPAISALIAFLFLGEQLNSWQIFGMGLSLSGIGLVVSDRSPGEVGLPTLPRKQYVVGLLFGLGAAFGQAGGLILSKLGLTGDYSVISANVMRMAAAAVFIWLVAILQGQARKNFSLIQEKKHSIWLILGGVTFGPVIGVSLSLLAVQQTEVGIASTIMALPPVFLLPIGYLFFNERFGWKAILGTVIAICGVAALFLI